MSNESNDLSLGTYVAIIIAALATLLWLGVRTESCRPESRGEQRVLSVRGGRVEECNGAEWVPYRNEVRR